MAPIKFEENIKDKLEKRSLSPSPEAWNKLSARLDKEEEKGSKKSLWWLGIAASFVGVLLFSNFFFNSSNPNNIDEIIVNDNTKTIISNPTKDSFKTQKDMVDAVKNHPTTTKKKTAKKEKNRQLQLALNTSNKKPETVTNKNTPGNTPGNTTLEDKNTDHSLGVAKNTINKETETITVSDSELHTLLSKASKEISTQKSNQTKAPIDHNSLLLDVEDELEESFRDKILKTLKSGYETTLETLAERND